MPLPGVRFPAPGEGPVPRRAGSAAAWSDVPGLGAQRHPGGSARFFEDDHLGSGDGAAIVGDLEVLMQVMLGHEMPPDVVRIQMQQVRGPACASGSGSRRVRQPLAARSWRLSPACPGEDGDAAPAGCRPLGRELPRAPEARCATAPAGDRTACPAGTHRVSAVNSPRTASPDPACESPDVPPDVDSLAHKLSRNHLRWRAASRQGPGLRYCTFSQRHSVNPPQGSGRREIACSLITECPPQRLHRPHTAPSSLLGTPGDLA